MKLKLIQVGLGRHGEGVAENFVIPSKDFTYAGLVDIDQAKVEECGKRFSVPLNLCYTDYRKAFRELTADAVLIVAASPVHYEICKDALANNLHILVEKPFVLTMEQACDLVREAEEKNLKIMVNQNYRYFNTVLTLKEAIKQMPLGKPLFADVQFYYNHIGLPYQCKMDDFMLLEMAVHHIDMARFLFDCNMEKVMGKTWNIPGSMYKGDPNVHAIFEMESGISVFYTGSLVSKGISMPWEGAWRIQCENGSIHLDDLGDGYGVYLVKEYDEKEKMQYTQQVSDGIAGVLEELAEAIRQDRQPLISGRDNLNTLATIFAVSSSSKEHIYKYPAEFIKC